MVLLIIYILGIFITPIIVKKFNYIFDLESPIKGDQEAECILGAISVFWPFIFIIVLLFQFFRLLSKIYDKI